MLNKLSHQKILDISAKELANLRAKPPQISEILAKCLANLAFYNHAFSQIFRYLRNAGKYHGHTSYLGLFSKKFRSQRYNRYFTVSAVYSEISETNFKFSRNASSFCWRWQYFFFRSNLKSQEYCRFRRYVTGKKKNLHVKF